MRTRDSSAERKSDIRRTGYCGQGRDPPLRFGIMTTAGPRRVLAPATSILPRGSGIVGAWLLVTGPRELRLPHDHGPGARPGAVRRALGARGRSASSWGRALPAGRAGGVAGAREPAGPRSRRRTARPSGGDRDRDPRRRARRLGARGRDRGSSTTSSTTRCCCSSVWSCCSRATRSSTWCAACSPATRASVRTASCSAPRPGAACWPRSCWSRSASRPPVRTASCSASRRSSACWSRSAGATGSSRPDHPRRGAS